MDTDFIVQHTLFAPLTAFTATLLATWWLTYGRLAKILVDQPNRRSLHQNPVPRTGGIGILLGILLAWMIITPELPAVMSGLGLLLAISFLDDLRGVPIFCRLGIHLVAAGTLAITCLSDNAGLSAMLAATLIIAWMINLYNFMDGSDGLASGMTLSGFGFYGIAAWFAGNIEFAFLNFSVSAAAAAFLIFNFHPARIFMGDAGSVPLGYLAGVFGLIGWVNGYWAWWFPLLVFSPFIVDSSVTLARRLFRRERVWEAHRDHYYQRLVQLGWGHRNTALAEYVLMIVCGVAALAALRFPQTMPAMITLLALTYIVLTILIMRAWSKMQGTRKSCD